jgi:hypothetical protein
VSPYGGWQETRASAPSPTPPVLLDAARFSSSTALPISATWSLGVGDDGTHALLAARRANNGRNETTLFEVEDGHSPVELRRADGEPFGDLDAALRAGGRWYVATPPSSDWTSIVWQVDGPIARELARVPRAGMDTRPAGARLARRSDGRAIGFVVDGQPAVERPGPQRWVLPIDVETGALGEPEPLGLADMTDRGAMAFCGEDDVGWILDSTFNLGVRLYAGEKYAGSLMSVDARVRITPAHACVDRLAGTMGALGAEQVATLTRGGGGKALPVGQLAPAIPVVVISASSRATQMRYPLRCVRR